MKGMLSMKTALAISAALLTAPVAAAPVANLAGVSDEETVIRSSQLREFHRGKGDVVFVRDRTNAWYRMQLNEGCLEGPGRFRSMTVDSGAVSDRIDKFSTVTFYDGMRRTCMIDSIRRSVAPPQVDSTSPITLD